MHRIRSTRICATDRRRGIHHVSGESPMSVRKLDQENCDRIKVLVLHADPIARAGLSAACNSYPDLEVREALSQLEDESPIRRKLESRAEVVVADYSSGVALATRYAQDPAESLKIVVSAGIDREWEMRNALERGVRGYLLVDCA